MDIRNDGTLDYKCFIDELNKFYEIVKKNVNEKINTDKNDIKTENVNWELKKFNDDIGGLVLIRKSLIKIETKSNQINNLDIDQLELEEIDDKNLLNENVDQNIILMEHQIIYSITYSVPILYFKGCYLNGKSLKIEDIWKLIPKFCSHFSNEQLDENKLITMITQFEHPILQKPFYAVHPCKTSELMCNLFKTFEKTKMNYILTWLSTIGSISGLKIDYKE